ncbi:MAG: exodeoxyribonuclease VII large subunit [Saprospiraceae bacterium]|nr:exodeoxyribonuclease VII large subunit [Saprospiraceae bacterium]
MSVEAYSLYQVNEFIKRSIAINFPAPIWVQAEIGQIRQSRRHWYLELVEKGEFDEDIIAQTGAVIWARNYASIKRKVGEQLDSILADGMEVMVKCQVSFHERYGLKFSIEDVQAEFTLGKLAKERQATIENLKKLNLLGANALVEASPVFQKIAVISADTAAGYQDFVQHLHDNPYGYHYSIDLFKAAMQGPRVEPEVLEALNDIKELDGFDAVVIIRGGGSRLDLAGFDSLLLSKAIALYPIPVLTGIGHDIDEAVVDLVAYKPLKTPTAVAEFLVHHNAHFEEEILEQIEMIQAEADHCLQLEKEKMLRAEEFLRIKIPALLSEAQHSLDRQLIFLSQQVPARLNSEQQKLSFQLSGIKPAIKSILERSNLVLKGLQREVELLSPDKILERGFSINLINGKAVGKNNIPKPGSRMRSITRIGDIESIIEEYEPKE